MLYMCMFIKFIKSLLINLERHLKNLKIMNYILIFDSKIIVEKIL